MRTYARASACCEEWDDVARLPVPTKETNLNYGWKSILFGIAAGLVTSFTLTEAINITNYPLNSIFLSDFNFYLHLLSNGHCGIQKFNYTFL